MEKANPAPANAGNGAGTGSLNNANVRPQHSEFNDLEAFRHWERIGSVLYRSGERTTAQFVAWFMTTLPHSKEELDDAIGDFTRQRLVADPDNPASGVE